MRPSGLLLRNAAALLASQGITKLLNIGVSIAVVRWLGARDLGRYSYVLAFCHPFGALADFGLGTLGAAKVCPAEWMPRFGPGSKVLPDRAAYPSLGELVSTFDRGHAALLTAVAATPAARWAEPHGWPFLQQELPTVADALAHLMTTHAAAHLGQLSAWRRGLGLPGVLGF